MADTATEATSDVAVENDHHEPTPREYVQIAAALAVMTAMEFSTYFIDFGLLSTPLLLVLMAIKFVMIAGFFMHLKFDTRVFRQLMLLGLGGALTLYLAATLALHEFPAGTGLG